MASFADYARHIFGGELTNALLIALAYGLILNDLRTYLDIEKFFDKCKIRKPIWKVLLFAPYYFLVLTIGLLGLFVVIFVFWLVSLISQ